LSTFTEFGLLLVFFIWLFIREDFDTSTDDGKIFEKTEWLLIGFDAAKSLAYSLKAATEQYNNAVGFEFN
jgi:hypothetical protein